MKRSTSKRSISAVESLKMQRLFGERSSLAPTNTLPPTRNAKLEGDQIEAREGESRKLISSANSEGTVCVAPKRWYMQRI